MKYDIAIVGGGLVGASLAAALSGHGFKILMIEAWPFRTPGKPGYDDRTLALSHASRRILEAIDLWPGLQDGVTAIREIRVSAAGRFGTVRIGAEELNVEALGHVVEARLVGAAVVARIPQLADVELLSPARLVELSRSTDRVTLKLDVDGEPLTLETQVLVGADGAGSAVRSSLGLKVQARDYGQTAVIANVTPDYRHDNRAFERLTDTGPMALLPHQGQRCGAVWSMRSEQVEAVLALDDAAFLEQLQDRAGFRLGRLQKVGKRSSYPLRLVYAPETVAGRCVIIGNAAHAIHPVAAQGFNLGLRDVAMLAEALVRGRAAGQPVAERLLAYQQQRRADQQAIVRLTDSLIDIFALRGPLASAGISLGMALVDRLPAVKARIARQAMGYGGQPPALALKEPL